MKLVELNLLLPAIFLLSCTIFMLGWYVESSITKDTSVADDRTVFFYLTDDSYIKSFPQKHHCAEEGRGYRVKGILVQKNHSKYEFEGVLLNSQIERVTVEQLNWTGTAFMVVGASLGIAIGVFVASGGSFPH